jgi:hypothetical protein
LLFWEPAIVIPCYILATLPSTFFSPATALNREMNGASQQKPDQVVSITKKSKRIKAIGTLPDNGT